MKQIFMINGPARCGKDTLAKFMKEDLEEAGKKVEIISFAEPLKEIIAKTFDIQLHELDHYKNNTNKFDVNITEDNRNSINILYRTNFRKILQRFGTEAMKSVFGKSVWVDIAKKKIKESNAEYFIIPDFRFHIEADGILELVNEDIAHTEFIYIHSDMCTISENQHSSETELEGFEFDIIINNMQGELDKTKYILHHYLENFR